MTIVRALWRFLVGVKDALVLAFMLLFFIGLWAGLSARAPLSVPGGAALVLNLNGSLVDQARERSPFSSLGGGTVTREYQTRDVVRAISGARTDDRIKAIVLQMDTFLGGGQANLSAVGAELDRFRAAGKPVYAYATAYTDSSYQLAAHSSEVWANPLGGVFLTGPGGENLYFADALKRLGVTVNVFKVGTYKAAVEPFTRTDSSPEAKLAEKTLLDTLWSNYIAEVRAVRPKADIPGFLANLPARVAAEQGDLGQASMKAGLIDKQGSYAALSEALIKKVGVGEENRPGSYNQIDLNKYLAASKPGTRSGGDAVGVVYVSGNIVDGDAGPGSAGGDTIAKRIEETLGDKSIKALVVRVDSGGGSVLASERIRAALAQAKAKGLPIVGSMGPVAASGGYWVSTAADMIFAQPSTITGSIGVFAIIPSFEGSLKQLHIGADGVKSTPYSGSPDVLAGLSTDTRSLLQSSVEDIYRRFTGLVATARHLTPARVDEIGQGRVWAGSTALTLGLVDKMGGLDAAIAEARRRAKLPADSRVVDIEPKPRIAFAFLSRFLQRDEEGEQGARDLVGKIAASRTMRLEAATAGALGMLEHPSVQAACTECWAWTSAPAPASDTLARAAVVARLVR